MKDVVRLQNYEEASKYLEYRARHSSLVELLDRLNNEITDESLTQPVIEILLDEIDKNDPMKIFKVKE